MLAVAVVDRGEAAAARGAARPGQLQERRHGRGRGRQRAGAGAGAVLAKARPVGGVEPQRLRPRPDPDGPTRRARGRSGEVPSAPSASVARGPRSRDRSGVHVASKSLVVAGQRCPINPIEASLAKAW